MTLGPEDHRNATRDALAPAPPRTQPFSPPGPAPAHPPAALTDHHADPVILQAKAERWFLGDVGHKLLRAGGLPPVAASAAPTASSASPIRLLRGPPFRSLGHCRASRRSNDPGEGVGACFLPRHGALKETLRLRRGSRPARTPRLCRRVADLAGRPRSRYFRSRARLAPTLRRSSWPHTHWWARGGGRDIHGWTNLLF